MAAPQRSFALMSTPSVIQIFRQTLGRALRETGQALERLGVKTASLANTKHDFHDDPVPYEDHLSRHRHQFPLLMSGRPIVDPNVADLAPCSTLIGSVRIGPGASVWYGAVLRADDCANAKNEYEPWDLEGREKREYYQGGGIFRILPGHKNTENFDTFFETKHQLKANQLCDMFGFQYEAATNTETLKDGLKEFYKASDKPKLLEVFTPSRENDEILLEYFNFIK